MHFIPNHVIPVKIGGMKYFCMQNIPYLGDQVCTSYQYNKRLRNIKYINKSLSRISATIGLCSDTVELVKLFHRTYQL